jgi:hypothetical protein
MNGGAKRAFLVSRWLTYSLGPTARRQIQGDRFECAGPRTAKFQDAKAGSPFYIAFLHGRPDTFIIGYAVGDGRGRRPIGGRKESLRLNVSRPTQPGDSPVIEQQKPSVTFLSARLKKDPIHCIQGRGPSLSELVDCCF